MIFNRINKSIFFKLLIIIALAFIFIVYSTEYVFRLNQNTTHFIKMSANCVNFAKMIVDSIGQPLNKEKAIRISKKLKINIRIKKNNTVWSYPANMKNADIENIENFKNKDTKIGFVDGELIVYFKKNNFEYTINLEPGMSKYSTIYRSFTHLSLFFSTLSLLFIYIALLWLFLPIKKLHNAIKMVSKGNFKFPLKTKRKDELGDLINSFKEMREKIDFMVKAKEQLLLDVSHELRSPLTRIKLSLAMLDDIDEKNDIYSDINEIETMVNVLLDNTVLNKGESALKKSKTEIVQLIKESFRKCNIRDLSLNFSSYSDKIFLNVDKKWLKVLFRNIISNALKYSDINSKTIDINIRKDKKNILIYIKNYGVGISKNDLEKIFEPFYRVEKSRSKDIEGYGLGLGICKKIVDAHNGSIEINSDTENKITIVKISFEELNQ